MKDALLEFEQIDIIADKAVRTILEIQGSLRWLLGFTSQQLLTDWMEVNKTLDCF